VIRQVLIDLGPSYFRYMDSTAGNPTVLAKLLGFYTVEIRNLDSGTVKSKADLLVMENLFYDRKVAKTFDLKGIQGRKVKANPSVNGTQSSKTLFDGEWIEGVFLLFVVGLLGIQNTYWTLLGQQRTLMLVRPHSKVVLREAIKADSDYLSKSNIMDYSCVYLFCLLPLILRSNRTAGYYLASTMKVNRSRAASWIPSVCIHFERLEIF
jgi:1-phosphatidylinositol-3-phosphate 5-kinase